ncbi:MAG TPA: hypothetical protein VGN26_07305 [Armatimonadota bacterium]|jgi:hypothetical protein
MTEAASTFQYAALYSLLEQRLLKFWDEQSTFKETATDTGYRVPSTGSEEASEQRERELVGSSEDNH